MIKKEELVGRCEREAQRIATLISEAIYKVVSVAVQEEREVCKRIALDRWIVGQHEVAFDIAERIEARDTEIGK